jgi:predicted aspartyl protease
VGTFLHPITLIGPSGERQTLDALVDTGSTFTAVPASVLERLGVTAHRTIRLRLADGRTQERPVGRLLAELDGLEEEILCVFAAPEDLPTIGAHTLEALLLAVDPAAQRLVPVEGLWVTQSHA